MVHFTVAGEAVPQGALKAGTRKDGTVFLRNRSGGPLDAWRGAISERAYQAMNGRGPLRQAVVVRLDFWRTRPRGHYGRRGLRPAAPSCPATRPDLDKLTRAALDALTGICFADDAQVAELHAYKRYADTGGARLEVSVADLTTRKETPDGTGPERPDRAGADRGGGGTAAGAEGGLDREPAEGAGVEPGGDEARGGAVVADEGAVALF